jgi:capsule polysaccharide export protein KpsE/RkpR
MAIVIEEEKGKSNIIGILAWFCMLVIIAGAIYYIFFAAPELVVIAPPASLSQTTPISQITLHPEDVTQSQSFGLLKSYIPSSTAQGSASVGRSNPFVSP